MKVEITADYPLTPEEFSRAIKSIIDEYGKLGIHIRSAECYLDLVNEKEESIRLLFPDTRTEIMQRVKFSNKNLVRKNGLEEENKLAERPVFKGRMTSRDGKVKYIKNTNK